MIKINVDADPHMARRITAFEKSIKSLKNQDPVMYRQIGAVADVSTIKKFESGGIPSWQARKYKYPWPILKKTLLMMRKTLSYIRANWTKTGDGYKIDINSTHYGIYHQYGTKRLPVRKFVDLKTDERGMITRVIQKAVEVK